MTHPDHLRETLADRLLELALLTRLSSPSNVRLQMPVTIPSAALRQMTDAERARVLDAAFDWPQDALDNYLAVLDARIREFEHRYEMASSALSEAMLSGRLHDTADVSAWLFWAHLRDDLARKTRP